MPTSPSYFVKEVTELAVGVTELVAVLQSKTNPPMPLASAVFLLFVHYKTATCQQRKQYCLFLLLAYENR